MINIILVAMGAAIGALCRWQVGNWLNPLFQTLAVGTLVVNVVGCFLIGIAWGLHLQDSQKLLFITGFLGSFTTFSAFSIEIIEKVLQQKWLNALCVFFAHSLIALFATVLGIYIVRAIKG